MTNLKDSFLEAAARYGDTLQSAVVGWHYNDDESWKEYDKVFPVESWETASKKLDYAYDSGYGGADCHAVIVWGEKRVYLVGEYDGATGIVSAPRNPVSCAPHYGDVA